MAMQHAHTDHIFVIVVTDRECEQVDGGNLDALVLAGIDAMEEVMLCAAVTLLGLPCGG